MAQKLERSEAIFKQARSYIPSGTSNLNICPGRPRYIARGEGSRVFDVDGNEYTDFSCHWTTLVHGHNREVAEAAKAAVDRGPAFSFFCEAEYELAKLICDNVASVDQVKFANTGSTAIELAFACAFAVTGRAKIAKIEGTFHGASFLQNFNVALSDGPAEEPTTMEACRNTPAHLRENVVVLPGASLANSEAILRKHAKELACVLVDLNPRTLGCIPLAQDYVDMLRRVTKEIGALLIVDEVVSYRLDAGGAQKRYGLTPDLTTFGKIIGGGFPVGAVGGRRDLMSVFDHEVGSWPQVSIFGTFTANPISMSAGLKAMQMLTPESYVHLNRLGERVRTELNGVMRDFGAIGHATGVGSIFAVNIMKDAPAAADFRAMFAVSDAERMLKNRIHTYMFDSGFLFDQPFIGCVSTALRDEDVDRMAKAFRAGLETLREEAAYREVFG